MAQHTAADAVRPDPEASARKAGLRYVDDEMPGISRRRRGKGFSYHRSDGSLITGDERQRLEALAIPPAWSDVWICPDPEGHIQATGRDDEGRKQYLYHERWHAVRGEAKFERMLPFGEALPELRARLEHDLRRHGLPRDKVLALIAALLDRTLIRIGNEEYARENHAFGLTTLRHEHVEVNTTSCTFSFTGKASKKHTVRLQDRRLARVVGACLEAPGPALFQYLNNERWHAVSSEEVNAYLRQTMAGDFTAKDFRTWGGTVEAVTTLLEFQPCVEEKAVDKNIVEMVRCVAERLRNTEAICREYYIHPAVIGAYRKGRLRDLWKKYRRRKPIPQLSEQESALLHFLREHDA